MKIRWVQIALTLSTASLAACGGGDGGSAGDAGATDAGAGGSDAGKSNPFELAELNALVEALKTKTAGMGNPAELSYLIIPKGNFPFWQDLVKGAGKAGRDIGVRVELQIPVNSATSATQSKLFDDGVARGVSGIAIAPITAQEKAVAASINAAREAGHTQVVTIDTDSPGNRQLFVGNINTAWGVYAANQMSQLLKNTGKVVVLVPSNSASSLERRQGIVDGFAGTPIELVTDGEVGAGGCAPDALGEIACVDVISCDVGPECTTRLDAVRAKYPDLGGMISTSSLVGAFLTFYMRAATAESGAPQTIKVLTIDLSPEAEAGLVDGTVSMVLVQNAFFMGYVAVYALYSFTVLGEDAAKEVMAPYLTGPGGDLVDTASLPVTAENLAAYKAYQDTLRQ